MPQEKYNPPKTPTPKPETKAAEPHEKEHKGLIASLNIHQRLGVVFNLGNKFKVPIIAIFVSILLGVTAFRMLNYANPELDDQKYQENLSSFKNVHIDKKVVNRINQLKESQVTPGTQITSGRTNPFAE